LPSGFSLLLSSFINDVSRTTMTIIRGMMNGDSWKNCNEYMIIELTNKVLLTS
jgi:hypothetical protein